MSLDLQPVAEDIRRLHGVVTGPPREVAASAPIPLHDTTDAWLVVAGALNVFAMPLHEGNTAGAREFLFRLEVGSLCFGFATARGTQWRASPDLPAVVAVADRDTILAPMTRAHLEQAMEEDGERVSSLLRTYAQRVCEALVDDATGEATITPFDASPPLLAIDTLWSVLQAFHGEALQRIAQRLHAHDVALLARLETRRRADTAAEAHAVAAIASLLRPDGGALPESTGAPLHDALRLVGAELGVAFRMPAHMPPMRDLSEQARHIALVSAVACRAVRLEASWWHRDAGVLLAFTRHDPASHDGTNASTVRQQPVVLLPAAGGGYHVVNPVTGARVPADAEIAAGLASHALQFYRSLPAQPVRSADLLRFVASGVRGDIRPMLVAGAAAALLALLPPMLTRTLFDHVIPGADVAGLTTVLLALLVASVSGVLFEGVRAVSLLRMRTRAVHDLQLAVLDRLFRLPLGFFRRFAAGDLGRRAMAAMTFSEAVGEATVTTLVSGIAGSTALLLLFWYSVPLALLVCAMMLPSVVVTVFAARRATPVARARHEATGELSALMLESLRGIAKLRVAAAEPRIVARWSTPFRRQQRSALRFGMLAVHLGAFLSVLDLVARVAVFAAYAWLWTDVGHPLSTGAFVAFAAAEGTVRAAVLALTTTTFALLEQLPALERAAPLLAAVPETQAERPDPGALQGRIELSHVHFAYEADGPDILHDVSLDIPAGSFVAIVGPSGSGKSTLLRLLLGFETPRNGAIRFDGQELQLVDRIAVRRQIGVVLQNASLSLGDIYSNVTGGTPRPQAAVWEAARLAGIDDEIRAMPMGLQTLIPDGGASLSGGQRQRLLIARALINRPRILLFDEATSALDAHAQRCVSDNIASLHATRIVIAHRLSTIRHADRIIVLDRGRVVESGNYEQLMAHDGLFARLAAQQEH